MLERLRFHEARDIALCRLLGILSRIDIDSKGSQRYLGHFNKALGRLLRIGESDEKIFTMNCPVEGCRRAFDVSMLDNHLTVVRCGSAEHGQEGHHCCERNKD